jgi:hypothetical protein
MSQTMSFGVLLAQGLVTQAHARGRAGRQVLHQHVGVLQQLAEDFKRLRLLEVERQAFLGAVGPDEVRGLALDAGVVGAGEVARAGALDLDHARAEVGELAGAERRGDGVFEGDDGDAVEGAGHKFHLAAQSSRIVAQNEPRQARGSTCSAT